MKSSGLNPTVLQVMKAVSTESAQRLLNILDSDSESKPQPKSESQSKEHDSRTLIGELKLSKKQFYTMAAHLSSVGIIQRTIGLYHLTAFGKLVWNAIRLVEDTTTIYSKLKAIDAISTSEQITKEELMKLVNRLVDNEKIRELVKLKYSL